MAQAAPFAAPADPVRAPAISIVTAVLNRAGTIGDAVASLQAQTRRDFEHVVVDGGSTDGTLDILRRTADGRTRIASGPDAGIYDALNRGIARSRGGIVGLLHSDDVYASRDVLARVAAAFRDTGADAVYGDLVYVARDDPRRVVRVWRSGPFHPGKLRRGWMPPHPALFLRRSVAERLGVYDTRYRIAADYDAILRCFSQPGFRAVHVPEVFVRMRLGGASNRSPGRVLLKSREDLRALRANGIGGLPALIAKNATKLAQFRTGVRDSP